MSLTLKPRLMAQPSDVVIHFRVTADMKAQEAFERKIRHLKQINDHYPKIILTPDRFTPGNYDGIRVIQIVDWLPDTGAYNKQPQRTVFKMVENHQNGQSPGLTC